jgi:NAD(P)-dependent dehydrogenase (short-subunit alcohol dehydrogenase family)
MEDMLLKDKVAVITGGAGINGLGYATARLMAAQGAHVAILDLARAEPANAAARLGDGHLGLVADVTDKAACEAAATAVLKAFGRIDILVNNAGVACVKPIHEHTEAEWDRVMNVNVKSLFWAARQVVPVMQRQKSGAIVNIGSISSVCGMKGQGAYGPSKGAVIQLTRQMAIEYAADGIRVNAVCPGTVDTPLLQSAAVQSGNPSAFLQGLADGHPVGRIASAYEIARLIRFVCSDEAGFITGAILMIDGGYSAQ